MAIYRGTGGAGDADNDVTVTTITQKAQEANESATEAALSASAAFTSAENAATSYDSFDDRYLGDKSSDPTVDNDGDALITGALYFNTVSNAMQVYNGTAWTALTGTGAAEVNDLTASVVWANVPDANITQSSVTQHQAALSITESQVSDLGSYITASSTDTLTNKSGNISQWTNDSAYLTGNQTITLSGDASGSGTTSITVTVADDSHNHIIANVDGLQTALDAKLSSVPAEYLTQTEGDARYLQSFTETNDLTAAVTWANVPDANITQSSVTQHQAALSITESQISDLAHTTSLAFAAITSTPTTLSGYGITDAATSAQGALADSAVQPNDSPTFATVNATTVDLGDWTITESAGVLYFATGGTNKMKLDASGNLTVVGDVTAFGTI